MHFVKDTVSIAKQVKLSKTVSCRSESSYILLGLVNLVCQGDKSNHQPKNCDRRNNKGNGLIFEIIHEIIQYNFKRFD